MKTLLAVCLALVATAAAALDSADWPPPAGVEARMRELQSVLGSRESTPAAREAAREELSGLLKSPAGQARGRTPDERPTRPSRASIDPFPSIVKPLPASPAGPAPPLARMEIVEPPRPSVLSSGAITTPSNGFAIDPRSGAVLREIPGGYIDPRTGQVTAR